METRNGGSLTILASTWRNAGRIDGAGTGTLTFDGAWTNAGLVSLAGGTWKLGGTFGLASLGSYERTAGSIVVSGNLNLAGATLALGADTGSWSLEGGTIRNGTIVQTGEHRLRVSNFSGNTLDAVSMEGDLMLDVPTAFLRIRNGLTLAGTAQVNNGAVLEFDGSQTWGTGSLRFAGTGGFLRFNGQLTLGPSLLVHGGSGEIQAQLAAARLINLGTIATDVEGGRMFVTAARVDNQGTLRASAANSVLTVRSANFTQSGTIEELNGGDVRINP